MILVLLFGILAVLLANTIGSMAGIYLSGKHLLIILPLISVMSFLYLSNFFTLRKARIDSE